MRCDTWRDTYGLVDGKRRLQNHAGGEHNYY